MKIKLNKYQTALYHDDARIKVVVAGRRCGKTTFALIDAIKQASKPNQLIYYYAYTHSLAETLFFEPLMRLLPRHLITRVNKQGKFTIDLVNGSRIVATGIQQYDNRLRGSGINYAICDEVADFPQDFFTQVLYPSLSDKKGSLLCIGTPKGRGNYFYDLYSDPKSSTYTFTTAQAGFVDEEEIDRARYLLPLKVFKQEYEASFEVMGNAVYYSYDRACHIEQAFIPDATTYLCFDFNVDPMSCIVNQQLSEGVWCATKEFIIPNSNTNEICEIIELYLKENEFSGELRVTGDYTGNARKSVGAITSLTDYVIIDEVFRTYRGYRRDTMKVLSARDRVLALNARFQNSKGDIHQYVGYDCPKLHQGLIKLEVDASKRGYMIDGRDIHSHPTDALSYHAYNLYPIFASTITINTEYK